MASQNGEASQTGEEAEDVSSAEPSDSIEPPASAGERRNRRGERRRWRGGKPPSPPPFHAMFTDVYQKPQFFQKWVRKVEMWSVRVRHYKPMAEAALDLADAISGDAAPIVEDITWREINREDGIQRIFIAFSVFDEQAVYHVGDLMDQYDQFLRQRGETLLAMVARFEQLEQQ